MDNVGSVPKVCQFRLGRNIFPDERSIAGIWSIFSGCKWHPWHTLEAFVGLLSILNRLLKSAVQLVSGAAIY